MMERGFPWDAVLHTQQSMYLKRGRKVGVVPEMIRTSTSFRTLELNQRAPFRHAGNRVLFMDDPRAPQALN